MKRVLVALAIAAVGGYTVWDVYSPYQTLREMRTAITTGDAATFSSNVDYDVLRSDIRESLRRKSDIALKQHPEYGNIDGTMAARVLDQMVQGFINQRAFDAAIRDHRPIGVLSGLKTDANPIVKRTSIGRFTVTASVSDHPITIVFDRYWPGWKVTGVEEQDTLQGPVK